MVAAPDDSQLPDEMIVPDPDADHLLRREAFLLLFCAAFAGTVFLVWAWINAELIDDWSPQARRPIENLKDLLGPFLTAYVAARLYSAMVRRYERRLQRQRLLLAHILDTSADGIVTLDAQDRISTWNRGAEVIFGYAAADILGQPATVLYAPDADAAADLAELRRAVEAEGVVPNYVGERLTRYGRKIRTEVSTTILRDARGRYAGRASIFRDVTERDRSRDELARRESLAAIGEMAAAVAHEIKNPLAGIAGAVKVIGRGFAEDDPRREVVDEVQAQVRRLDETIRDLLTFARPTVARAATMNLQEFATRILRVLGEEPQLKRHAVTLDIDAGIEVHADPQLLENVLVNLLLNAGQALGARAGHIAVRASEDPGSTRIAVHDDGPGIPEEVLPRLFKPFFTTKARGTGLGLTIVRKFMEVMGGRIEVETHYDEGTTFTLILPRPREPATP